MDLSRRAPFAPADYSSASADGVVDRRARSRFAPARPSISAAAPTAAARMPAGLTGLNRSTPTTALRAPSPRLLPTTPSASVAAGPAGHGVGRIARASSPATAPSPIQISTALTPLRDHKAALEGIATLEAEAKVVAEKDHRETEYLALKEDPEFLELNAMDRLNLHREGERVYRIA